jgi:hypothetical protein
MPFSQPAADYRSAARRHRKTIPEHALHDCAIKNSSQNGRESGIGVAHAIHRPRKKSSDRGMLLD